MITATPASTRMTFPGRFGAGSLEFQEARVGVKG